MVFRAFNSLFKIFDLLKKFFGGFSALFLLSAWPFSSGFLGKFLGKLHKLIQFHNRKGLKPVQPHERKHGKCIRFFVFSFINHKRTVACKVSPLVDYFYVRFIY